MAQKIKQSNELSEEETIKQILSAVVFNDKGLLNRKSSIKKSQSTSNLRNNRPIKDHLESKKMDII